MQPTSSAAWRSSGKPVCVQRHAQAQGQFPGLACVDPDLPGRAVAVGLLAGRAEAEHERDRRRTGRGVRRQIHDDRGELRHVGPEQ
jgi:hypothetical protein